MKHRERAAARLSRHSYGWSEWDVRLPIQRIAVRAESIGPARAVPGESVSVREPSVRKHRLAAVGPYAPLLKRVIRSPYALETGRPTRVEGRVVPDLDRSSLEPRLSPIADARAELGSLREWVEPPMRAIEHRPVERPHPFWRIRRARGEQP
jgi:hypothetical protein